MSESGRASAERVFRKIAWRLLPLLVVSYLAAFVDRVNVGFAAISMRPDIGLTRTALGIGSGIFYITYFLLEVPSNLALARFGARRWLARIMMTWGIVSALTAFVWNGPSFFAVRLLLGAAEAGFYPGLLLYLTYFPTGSAPRSRLSYSCPTRWPSSSVPRSPASYSL